jgi:hypothetical protein
MGTLIVSMSFEPDPNLIQDADRLGLQVVSFFLYIMTPLTRVPNISLSDL